jgi:hypothetical protein
MFIYKEQKILNSTERIPSDLNLLLCRGRDLNCCTKNDRELASSVSIVPDYRLDSWGLIPTETEDFSCSLCVQTGSGAHPASQTVGVGNPFPGDKAWPQHDADHSLPSVAEAKKEELYLLSP